LKNNKKQKRKKKERKEKKIKKTLREDDDVQLKISSITFHHDQQKQ